MKVYLVMESHQDFLLDPEESIYFATFYKEKAISAVEQANALSAKETKEAEDLKKTRSSVPFEERAGVVNKISQLRYAYRCFEYQTVEVDEDSPPSL